MAAPKKEAAGAKPKPGKKSGKIGMLSLMMLFGIAAPFILPTIVLVLMAMIPTYVAMATDTDRQKSGAVSVGAMNFAGTVPFIIDLWTKGQTLPEAMRILTDSSDWLIILGAAGIGQLIVYAIPQAIATMSLNHAENRAKGLRKNLDILQESWGADVATVKPLDRINLS